MTHARRHLAPVPAAIDRDLVEVVRERIAAGKAVRRSLVGGGRLHVDRPLPFLCVYRPPADREDPGTAELVRTQAAYVIAPADPVHAGEVSRLVGGVVDSLAALCGGCLVLELWAGEGLEAIPGTPPTFRIKTAAQDRLATTIDALAEALRTMAAAGAGVAVEIVAGEDATPPGRARLMAPDVGAREGVLSVGLEVPPLYRSSQGVYPRVLQALSRELTHALQLGFFEFTRVQTPARPEHFHMMGRRRVVRAVRESDAALAAIGRSFDFLLAVTPLNTDAAWEQFRASGYAVTPTFHYRMLTVDPERGKRELYALPLDRLEDPVLALLLRDKRRELDRQLGLLEDRDTPRFLHGSLQLYEPVDDALLAEALAILEAIPGGVASPGSRAVRDASRCDAVMLAARAQQELAHYRGMYPALSATIEIRDDVTSLIVSNGNLLIPRKIDVPARRVDALLQHEVGTHVVTYANGSAQPLRILAAGLAGYEALQEGLAMFAEHLAGGLDGDRLRLVAARMIAVRRIVEGASFSSVFGELVDEHRMTPRAAFGIAVRVFRGGGLTKDAIYLRGLVQLLDRLRTGQDLTPLLVGKLGFEQIPLVEELLQREIVRAPLLRPRWLDAPATASRLSRAHAGIRPIDLVDRPEGLDA
jgi:uncharacterized protein (TIGR02421 family)